MAGLVPAMCALIARILEPGIISGRAIAPGPALADRPGRPLE